MTVSLPVLSEVIWKVLVGLVKQGDDSFTSSVVRSDMEGSMVDRCPRYDIKKVGAGGIEGSVKSEFWF